MKKICRYLFIVFLFNFCFVFMLLFIYSDKKNFSVDENRYLQKFSINKTSQYVVDHFPFRFHFVVFKNKFEKLLGKTYINGVYIGNDGYLFPKYNDCENKKMIIDTINTFQSKNKNVDVMIVPDSIEINKDKIKDFIDVDESIEIDYIYSKLNTNNINLIDTFKNINHNQKLYYKTDHHWNTFGAYYAYVEYRKNKNKKYYDIDIFNIKKVSNNFLGSSYYKILGIGKSEDIYKFDINNNLKVNYVYEKELKKSIYEDHYLKEKDQYSYFLNNNHALIEITNEYVNNGSIIVIKNSYANSFVPFLVNHYNKVYVIDLRYFSESVSDLIEENSIDDILILYNLNNLYSDLSIVKLQ